MFANIAENRAKNLILCSLGTIRDSGSIRKSMNQDNTQTATHGMRDLFFLTVLLSLFFAFMLGHRPLSVPDEGRYVEIPREMVATGDYLTPRLNGVKYLEKPALFYWLESLSIQLFGLKEFTLVSGRAVRAVRVPRGLWRRQTVSMDGGAA
jgi:hypothetical protein